MSFHETVEKLTGITKANTDAIIKAVKENQAKLQACAGPHQFSICIDRRSKQPVANPTPQVLFGCHWRCAVCGGQVEGSAKRWYELGLKHAKQV